MPMNETRVDEVVTVIFTARYDGLAWTAGARVVVDLTGPVLFLCSAQSAFVTGHVMYADGGRTLV